MSNFTFSPTDIPGVQIVDVKAYGDARGYFMETYKAADFAAAGIRDTFVQDNQSGSCRGVLRGLHFQKRHQQAKLVRAICGEIFDVAVDLRRGSATYGRWTGVLLSADNRRQLYIPRGFAHGFQVLSEQAVFAYKCGDVYHPEDEGGIRWDDTDIGIVWPGQDMPILSEKDQNWPALRALGNTRQPLIYLAIAGVLNVIMNLFFVIVVGIDVAGVAIATVLSQCVSGFLTVRCLLTSQELHVKELHFSGHIFKKMMNIGIPAGIQGSLFSISNFIIQASVNSFGAAVIAGNSACVSVEGLLYCPSDAVMQAATTAVSQNVGAQEYERSRSVARWSMVLVVVLTGILTVPAVVFRRQVLGLYTSSGAELEAAFTRMMIVCLTYSLDGTMAAMSGVNRGLGYSMLSAAVTFVGACVFRIIWVYTVFASVGTLESLYVSYPISWILSTAAHIVCYYIIRKKPFKATLEAKAAAA